MKLNGKTYRKVTHEEHKSFKSAIEKKLKAKLGRPFLDPKFKKKNITIKLSPQLIDKLKRRAKKVGQPYQALINEILEKAA